MSSYGKGVCEVPCVKGLDLKEVQHEVNQEDRHEIVRTIEFMVVEVVIEGPKFGEIKIVTARSHR
jgi:hypothetical protein